MFNPRKLSYLDLGPQRMLFLLRQFLTGSEDIFGGGYSLIDGINFLSQSLRNDSDPQRYKILLERNYHEMLVYILDSCGRIQNPALMNSVLTSLVNVTNNSEDFCEALMSTNLPEILIRDMIKHSSTMHSRISQLYQYSCGIIMFNIVRLPQFREGFRKKKYIEKVKQILKCFCSSSNVVLTELDLVNEHFQMTSIILIGFLVKENETEYINLLKRSNIIENIIKFIKKIRNGEYHTNSGFDVWELLLGLEALSSIENIKKSFFNTDNVMSTFISIMSSASIKSKEINVILLIIQNLINDDDIKEIIKNKYNIGKFIKGFKDCGTDLIEGLVKNILNKLEAQNKQVENKNIGSAQYNTGSSSILQFEDKIKYRDIKKIIYSGNQKNCNEKDKEELLDNKLSRDLKHLKLSQTESVADDFTQWTKNNVSEWLTKSNLSEIHNKFNEFNGEMIKSLLRLKKTEAATYYHQLEVSWGLSFTEILKLDSALSKLEE